MAAMLPVGHPVIFNIITRALRTTSVKIISIRGASVRVLSFIVPNCRPASQQTTHCDAALIFVHETAGDLFAMCAFISPCAKRNNRAQRVCMRSNPGEFICAREGYLLLCPITLYALAGGSGAAAERRATYCLYAAVNTDIAGIAFAVVS